MKVSRLCVLLLALGACSDETQPSPQVRFVSLVAGEQSACGLTAEGEAYCWGRNETGQLGTGDTERRLVPAPIAGAARFEMIDQGLTACGVASTAKPYCWGLGGSGVTGDGSLDGVDACEAWFGVGCNLRPQAVRTAERFREVVNNGGITCGLTEAGVAYCWGVYQGGYLGIGVVPDGSAPLRQCRPRFSSQFYFVDGRCATEPVRVAGNARFRSIAAGAGQVCGATESGDLLCWARPTEGDSTVRYAPVRVAGAPPFVALSGGASLLCGVTGGGEAYCMGEVYGSGGSFREPAPVRVGPAIIFSNVTVGAYHACGATPGGTAYCWGENPLGQLGDGSTNDAVGEGVLEPVFVAGGHSFRTLAAGNDFTCGITFEREVWCWGANTTGQFGNGRLNSSLVPVLAAVP